jgi:hypothetical protein
MAEAGRLIEGRRPMAARPLTAAHPLTVEVHRRIMAAERRVPTVAAERRPIMVEAVVVDLVAAIAVEAGTLRTMAPEATAKQRT